MVMPIIAAIVIAIIAASPAPAPRRAIPGRIMPGAMPAGVKTSPAPVPGRAIPGRIIPGIIPTIIIGRPPSPTVTYINIKAYISPAVRIIRIISISVITVAQVQIHPVGPDYGYFTGRMVTDNAFRIFRIGFTRFVFFYYNNIVRIIIIRFFRIDGHISAVIFINIATVRRHGRLFIGRRCIGNGALGCFLLCNLFLFYTFFLFIFV
jgi:hypothetical protein